MSDEKMKALKLLMQMSPGVLRELRSLTRFGRPQSRRKLQRERPLPVPEDFKQAHDAAKLRLDAIKAWSAIRWGTKSHGPVEADEETEAEIELARFRQTRKDLREKMLRREIAEGRMTLEDANAMCELVGDEPIELQEDSGEPEQGNTNKS